jgi:hypothetical protein
MRSMNIFAALLLAGALLGACKRTPKTDSKGETASAEPGCLETNPRPGIAAACMACIRKNSYSPDHDDGCCAIRDAVGRQLCEAASTCIRSGMMSTGDPCNVAGDSSNCFCGTHPATCSNPGGANGPCIAQITAAAGRNLETQTTDSPSAADVLDRFGNVKYALGRATTVATLAGTLCPNECEIKRW